MAFRNPNVSLHQVSLKNWKLDEPLFYQGREDQFEVPSGFVTDFASVPRAAIWLVPTYGAYTPAAILHDILCIKARQDNPEVSRRDADGLFRRCLRELGVPGPRRWLMWCAVRWGGGLSDTTVKEFFQVLLLSLAGLVTVVPPMIVVQVYLLIIWVFEKITSKNKPPSPAKT